MGSHIKSLLLGAPGLGSNYGGGAVVQEPTMVRSVWLSAFLGPFALLFGQDSFSDSNSEPPQNASYTGASM